MRRAAASAAVAAVVIVVALAAVLAAERRPRSIGSNYVRATAFVAEVQAGRRVCQPGQQIPAGTGAIGLRAGTFARPGPPLELTIDAEGRQVATGTRQGGWSEGDVMVPIRDVARIRTDARVCVRNLGPDPIAIGGGRAPGSGAFVDGRPAAGGLRLTFFASGSVSWLGHLGEMERRAGFLRDAAPGGAGLVIGLLVSLTAMIGSLVLVLREVCR